MTELIPKEFYESSPPKHTIETLNQRYAQQARDRLADPVALEQREDKRHSVYQDYLSKYTSNA